jgi:hypothetical protein
MVDNPPSVDAVPRYGGTVQFDNGTSEGCCAIETEEAKTTRRTTGVRITSLLEKVTWGRS